MAEPPSTYTREEMDAILKRALERQQAKSEGIAHEDLVAAAAEVGIPREELEAAARELETEKARSDAGSAPKAAVTRNVAEDAARARAMAALKQRAFTFFGLGMFFFLVGGEFFGQSWWIWPVFGLAVSLLIHAVRVYADPGGEARAERRARRRESRRERKRRRHEARMQDFEEKVAMGADAIIRVIEQAKRIKDHVEEAHAAHEREGRGSGGGPRVIVTPPPGGRPGGVRVEAREREEIEDETNPRGRARR